MGLRFTCTIYTNKIIESQSNMSIFEFANDNLFEPLKISNVYWFQDDSGLAFGGFGLYLTSRKWLS